ncbi:MAG: MurR/RpiR family transcriptional regulator [Pseudomonadota bacterium]
MPKRKTDSNEQVDELIKREFESLTRSERHFADLLLSNYPVSGIGSITQIAQKANVSPPTIVRLVKKLGFSGFPEFQSALRVELEAKMAGPISKHDSWVQHAPDSHILNRFADVVTDNIRQTLGQIETDSFDASSALLANAKKPLYVVGGRITRALADYLFLHMQVIRSDVTHIQSISNSWPHYLLDMNEKSVLVIFDIRRYEKSLLTLASAAHKKGATIILFTDQWRSPIEKFAHHMFCAKIVAPSAWDSTIGIQLIVETFVAAVQELNWDKKRGRIEELEELFDKTQLFEKFH